MKINSFIILVLFFISNSSYSQDHDIKNSENLRKTILFFIDSLHSISYYNFSYSLNNSVYCHVNHENITIDIGFPAITNEQTAKEVFFTLDSLAKTPVFANKAVANAIFAIQVEYYSLDKQCSSCYHGELENWQKKFVIDMAKSAIDNCLRITDNRTIFYLNRELFTSEITNRIIRLFSVPYLTEQEAGILAQKDRKSRYLTDTNGYTKMRSTFSNLTSTQQWEVSEITYDLKMAKKKNMTLNEYYDSLNILDYRKQVSYYSTINFIGISDIIECIGNKRIYELAPLIDSINQVGMDTNWKINSELILARLNYKDYPNKMIEKYSNLIDTTIDYLHNNILDFNHRSDIVRLLSNYMHSLIYIGTQESYSRIAPLLLIKEKGSYYYENGQYIIGAIFFRELENYIGNFPQEMKNQALEKYGPSYWFNENFIEKYAPKDFLEKMYKWMVGNKGNYQLKQD